MKKFFFCAVFLFFAFMSNQMSAMHKFENFKTIPWKIVCGLLWGHSSKTVELDAPIKPIKISQVTEIPDEVLLNIFCYVGLKETVNNLIYVNKRLKNLISQKIILEKSPLTENNKEILEHITSEFIKTILDEKTPSKHLCRNTNFLKSIEHRSWPPEIESNLAKALARKMPNKSCADKACRYIFCAVIVGTVPMIAAIASSTPLIPLIFMWPPRC